MNFPRARVHQQHGRTMEEKLTRLEDMLARYLEITLGSNREDARSSWKGSSVPHSIKTPRVGSSANSKSEVRKFEKGIPKQDRKVVVCPKCNGFGHVLKECSNKHAFTIEEWKEIRSKSPRKSWVVETENGVEELPEDEEGKCDEPLSPETQHVMVVPKEVVVQPQVRKFEIFETLFDPPKFLPDFMKEDIDDVKTVIIEAREKEYASRVLEVDIEQGTESFQGKESEGIQEAPKDDMVRPTIRKFEVFETLFDPPKFIPEFMKQNMVNDVEATKFVQCDDEAVFIDGICEEDRGNKEAEAEVLFCSNEGPFHVINTYAFGSLTVIELNLNKIRGRIFLKKGRMNQAWGQVMLTERVSEHWLFNCLISLF